MAGTSILPQTETWELLPDAPAAPAPALTPNGEPVQEQWVQIEDQDPDVLRSMVINPFMRGASAGQAGIAMLKRNLGMLTDRDLASYMLDDVNAQKRFPMTAADKQFQTELQGKEGWDQVAAVIGRPQLWLQTMVQSLPASAPSIAGGAVGAAVGGPVGAAAGAGAGSFATEFNASMLDAIRTATPDGGLNEDTIVAALQNPAIMAKAREFAAKRGIGVAIFDALSFGLAGKLAGPVAGAAGKIGAPKVVAPVSGAVAETVQQGASGAAGEAAAQLLSTGGVSNLGDVALEAVAEVPGAVIEPVVGKMGEALRGKRPEPVRLPIPTEPIDNPNVQSGVQPEQWVPVIDQPPAPPTAQVAPPTEQVPVQPETPVAQAPVAPVSPVEPPPSAPAETPPAVVAPAPAAPAAPAAVQPAQPASVNLTPGRGRERVSTADKSFETDTEFEVVEADSLKAADGADQPRDRANRPGSGDQIRSIASKLDPLDLLSSRNSDTGAPIIDENGVVLSGNGRTAAIIAASENFPERYAAYRSTLEGLGYDTSKMKTPVLVRRARGIPEDKRRLFTTRSQFGGTQRMSAPEMARVEADYISPDMLAGFNPDVDDGVSAAANADFVRQFMNRVPETEKNALAAKDGRLSLEGEARLTNAIFAKAYGDKRLVDWATETDTDPALKNALMGAAAGWANMREKAPDFDVTGDLIDALALLNAARGKGMTLPQFLSQTDAFAAPPTARVSALARLLVNKDQKKVAAWRDIRDRLRALAEAGVQSAGAAGDMLGGRDTVDDVIRNLVQKIDKTTERDDGTSNATLKAAKQATPAPAASTPAAEPEPAMPSDGSLFGGETLSKKPMSGKAAPPDDGLFAPKAAAAPQMLDMEDMEDTADLDPEIRDDRKGRGTLAPQTEDVSRSKGPSKYRAAWRAAGLDPDEGNLKSPSEKISILRNLLARTFGFRAVRWVGSGPQEAVAQMLNAFRNVHFMMHALQLPLKGVSLGGTLTIDLENSRQRYFGVYRPDNRSIGMPGMSNSFAHEWMHALDHFMADRLKGKADTLLSTLTRNKGLDPAKSIENAFINLVHAMFFDDAALALKALDLERAAAAVIQKGPKAGQPTVAALEAQKTLERLKSGATRLNIAKSDYKLKSEAFDPGTDYWASVHEMMARAFEAYVASKVESLGGTNEFITKGEEAYLSDADRRLAMTFPKVDDRVKIFAAFDDVFAHVRSTQFLGNEVAADRPADIDIADDLFWEKQLLASDRPTAAGAIKEDFRRLKAAFNAAAARGVWGSLKDSVSYLALNMGLGEMPPAKAAKIILDTTRMLLFSTRGATMPVILRNIARKGRSGKMERGGGDLLMDAFRGFSTRPGDGQTQAATYEDEGHQQSTKDVSKLAAAMEKLGFKGLKLTDAENDQAREMLFGKSVPGADPRVRKLASLIRDLFDAAHARATSAGREIGYIMEKGYLPRILDRAAISEDKGGFIAAAEKVYRIVFDRLVKSPGFKDNDLIKLADSVDDRMGNTTSVSRFAAEVSALRSAIKALNKALEKLESLPPTATAAQKAPLEQAVKEAAKDHREAQKALIAAIRDPFAEVSARDWHTRVEIGDSLTFEGHGPASSFTDARVLPPEADDIMADFYNTDVLSLASNYLGNMNSRTAYHKRAGNSGGTDRIQEVVARDDVKNRIAMNPSKYRLDTEAGRRAIISDLANPATDNILEMRLRSAAELGVPGADVQYVRRAIESISGRGQRGIYNDILGRFSGFVYGYTYLRLLTRMSITALSEPASVYLRTGNAKALFSTFAAYLSEINQKSKTVAERQALARAMGIITSPLYDTLLIAQLGLAAGHVANGNKLLSRFFQTNFAAAITNAQRRAVMSGGFIWMRDMAQKHANPKTEPVWKASIEAEFRELGVRDEDMASFMDWLTQAQTMPDLAALNTKAGKIFEQATYRFVGQVIQNPTRADKPMLASTALGRLAWSLTSYLYTFFANVHSATAVRAVRNYKLGREVGNSRLKSAVDAGVPAANSLVVGFAIIWAAQLLTATIRESIFNGEQYEKHRADGDLFDWLSKLALSRTGVAGPADVVLNAMTGLKYERDLSNIMAGPGLQNIFNDLGQMAALIPGVGRNDPDTNTGERNAAKAFYRMLIAPLSSAVITAMPDSFLLSVPKYAGLVTLSSNSAAAAFADMVAGPKQEK